ncbi:MAG: proline dehydrogenase family protein [Gemmatimonadaceae bacterium]
MLRGALLKASGSPWLKNQLMRRRFANRAVRKFMPGESLEDALDAATKFQPYGIGTIITQLGENVTQRSQAEGVCQHYLHALDEVRSRGLDSEPSVKLTQLGLDVSKDLCVQLLDTIAARAQALGNSLWIDMEGSPYTEVTLELYRAMRSKYPRTGVALQAYLRRSPADLEQLLAIGATVRLVKGAYREPADIALQSRHAVDDAYFGLATRMLRSRGSANAGRMIFGTHDMRLLDRVAAFAAANDIARSAYEVHMLYGIRTADQIRLAREGHTVRALISYGSAWFQWYMRRLAEKPSNLWFVVRSVVG